jgi:hypothetical protein
MRRSAVLPAIAILVLSCSGNAGPPTSSQSSASRTTPTSTGAAIPTAAGPLTGPYGLIYGPAFLEVIKPDGAVAARVSMAMPSVQYCSSANDAAIQAPPVSASNDQIYFRDGDTKIRMVVRPSSATDVTTVPGGANVVSFFSVSPDDQRIAVLVEDLTSPTIISERLYVEDLHGGGHHADIYSTTQPKGQTDTTLWPMGWHQGALVLAVVNACTFEPAGLVPLEWHVSNATTANRIATIRGANCTLSFATSPAGVGCTDSTGATTLYDWSGKLVLISGPGVPGFESSVSGVSPAGNSFYFAIRPGIGAPPPATRLVQLGPGPYATAQGHSACAWIDEDHLLAPDAVIQFPAETPGNLQVNSTVTPLAQPGACAGRFPGAL